MISTKMHTIFLMVGASESGKTTFSKKILIPQLQIEHENKNYRSNVQYISSDEIRQQLLGYNYHKHSQIMLESSKQAFELLFQRLRAVTTFPVNADFVIVDTTGLSDDFREEVRKVAQEHHYNLEVVLFDYDNYKDYFTTDCDKKIVENHVQRLKRDVVKTLTRKKYNAVHRIKAKDFYNWERKEANPLYTVNIRDWERYASHLLDRNYNYIIVGDVHESIDDLKALLSHYGYIIDGQNMLSTEKTKDYRIILNGDWIDKGRRTKETIEFIYHNLEFFLLGKGNHENFIFKYLSGKLDGSMVDQETIDNYFTSIEVLANDRNLQEQFFYLVEHSKEFYRYIGIDRSSYYATHAPCENRYIGKLDKTSLRGQRNFRLNRGEAIEPQLNFIKEEASSHAPFHIYGHVACKEIATVNNKINLDTGCTDGNKLSSVIIRHNRPVFKQVKSKQTLRKELPLLFAKKENVAVETLDIHDQRRLEYVLKNKINYISGTMSPADKDEENSVLESLQKGLHYFQKKGVEKVVLQPKYMGSRCNVYLHRDLAKSYAVSRNGYKIKNIDLTQALQEQHDKFIPYMKGQKIELMLLDCELMPWRTLGEGLIEEQFDSYSKAIEAEISFLQNSGFEEKWLELSSNYQNSNFEQDSSELTKKELIKIHGPTYQTYKNKKSIQQSIVSLEKQATGLATFNEQLDYYAENGPITLKPFTILKVVKSDGDEERPMLTASEMFAFVSDDEYHVVDFKDEHFYEKALRFYETLTVERHMEGVVIKPEIMKNGVAPFLKVRNENYLTLVYGYDYKLPHKYSKLIKQKNTGAKLRTSMKEYALAEEMLSFKWSEISLDNTAYKQVVANMLFETKKEKEIDPRL
ncbi:AAA family ATPase [Bacillus sp. JJ722]|uniref:AAA family ATPase n=1 Tax=Bacillus sp. JJ722 TaxID=3122973 RepID=UPI002FFDD184